MGGHYLRSLVEGFEIPELPPGIARSLGRRYKKAEVPQRQQDWSTGLSARRRCDLRRSSGHSRPPPLLLIATMGEQRAMASIAVAVNCIVPSTAMDDDNGETGISAVWLGMLEFKLAPSVPMQSMPLLMSYLLLSLLLLPKLPLPQAEIVESSTETRRPNRLFSPLPTSSISHKRRLTCIWKLDSPGDDSRF